jgi:ankyrin repeat protein
MDKIFLQAIRDDDLNTVIECVQKGYDKRRQHIYVIKCCAINGRLDILKYLIEMGYEPHRGINDRALKWAAIHGHLPIVKYLLENFACNCYVASHGLKNIIACWFCKKSYYHYPHYKKHAFRLAAKYGHMDIVKYFCEDYVIYDDDSAFRFAARYGHLDIVNYLLRRTGADVENLDYYALRWSLKNKHYDIVKRLLKNSERSEQVALRQCAATGDLDAIKYLIGIGCDPTRTTGLVVYPCGTGHIDMVNFLISWNCDPLPYGFAFISGFPSNWEKIQLCVISSLTKKAMFKSTIRSTDNAETVLEIVKKNYVRKCTNKHNFLKFVLKPKSLCMQWIACINDLV